MSKNSNVGGIAFMHSTSVRGYITLNEKPNGTIIQAHLSGLKPKKKYGWHIHEKADLRLSDCKGLGGHYNPFNQKHGGPRSKERHVGDLGNLKTDEFGQSNSKVTIKNIKLKGRYSVMGRSIVIHEKPDDLGKANTHESHATGSSGKRIACGVIGYK